MFELSTVLLSTLPPGRVFALDRQTLISIGINLFNVALLAFVLSKLLYSPVRGFMAARTQRVNAQLEDAATQLSKANAQKEKYEALFTEIESQREEILREAKALAAQNLHQVMEEARQEAQAIKQRAATEAALERQRAREEVRQVIIEVSAAMTEKVIAASIDKEMHERMFAGAVAELEQAKWLA